jgi:glycosyltransferase involved in cell wall biosynthesis
MVDPALLSVIIPTYNSAHYLPAALESVNAQAYRPLEVIIIDDGSTDDTATIVADFFRHTGLPGCYRYQTNQGPGAARNHGLTLASGGWIAFLDADDLWLPDKTSRQMQVFDAYPQAGGVWGHTITFAGDISPSESPASLVAPAQPAMLLQSMLFRRTVIQQVGLFPPELRLGEDMDWLLRALEQSVQIVIHPNLVTYYRRHATNLTFDKTQVSRTIPMLIKRSLDRQRAQGMGVGGRPSSLLMLQETTDGASTSAALRLTPHQTGERIFQDQTMSDGNLSHQIPSPEKE